MIKKYIGCLSVCAVAVFLIACPSAATRGQQLKTRVLDYHNAYQHGDLLKASTFVADPEDYRRKMKAPSKDFEITEVEVTNIQLDSTNTEASVEVTRSYIDNSTMTLHKQTLEQKWKYDRRKTDWFLVSPY